MDPETLLPQHRSLLEADFESLGSGSTVNCLIRLANVDSAIAASTLTRLGTLSPAAAAHFDMVGLPSHHHQTSNPTIARSQWVMRGFIL